MLDHEERFLFREEIHNLANALADPGQLDNVEDLLAEVTTSPRFDADVFTLERSLQVMLGARAGSTLVGLLTVDRGVFLIPDILCNAGGVTVSYFEWVQDMQSFFWTEDRINDSLKGIMDRAFADVHAMSERHEVDMRTAAYMVAVARVAEATTLRGLYP